MKRSSDRTIRAVSILMILAVSVAAYPSGLFPEGEEAAPADPERNSTLEEGKLGVLASVERETILGLLREQEAHLRGGLWVYTVRASDGEGLPEKFSEETFTGGLARLKAKPSFLGQGVLNASEMERIAAALEFPGSAMIVLLRGEGYIKLLAPLQMYGLDAEGRECHEFTRYYVTDSGRLLSQEIVRRVYIPGQGGRKLVTTEVVSSTPTTEMWVRREPYGRDTREAGLTAWQFGLGFDAEPTSGSRTVSQGLAEWDAIHWSYELDPEADTALPLENTPTVFTFHPERRGSAPDGSEDEVAYLQLDYKPSDPNLFLRPLVMGWASVGSSSVKYLFVDSWLEDPEGDDNTGDGNGVEVLDTLMSEDAPTTASARPVVPQTARMSETRESAVPGAEGEAVYDYDLILFNADDTIDPSVFDSAKPTGTKVHDETLNLDLTLGEDPLAVFASAPPSGEIYKYAATPICTQFWLQYYWNGFVGNIVDMNNSNVIYRTYDPQKQYFQNYGMGYYATWVTDYDDYWMWNYTYDRYDYIGVTGDGSFPSWVHHNFAVPNPGHYYLNAYYQDDNLPKCADDGDFAKVADLYLIDVQIVSDIEFITVDPDRTWSVSASVTPSVPGTYTWSTNLGGAFAQVRFLEDGQLTDTATGQTVTIFGNNPSPTLDSSSITVSFTSDQDSLGLSTQDSDTENLTVYAIDYSYGVGIKRYGSVGTYSGTCGFSVGGYDSDIHKADVRFTMTPANNGYTVSLPVYMANGGGSPPAVLTLDDSTVVGAFGPDVKGYVTFDNTNEEFGILTSSNYILGILLKGLHGLYAPQRVASAAFEWPYQFQDWEYEQYFLDETYTPVSVEMKFNDPIIGAPMDKHQMKFYAYEVNGWMWANHQYQSFSLDFNYIDPVTGGTPYMDDLTMFSSFHSSSTGGGEVVTDTVLEPGKYTAWQVVHSDDWWYINDVKFLAVDNEVHE